MNHNHTMQSCGSVRDNFNMPFNPHNVKLLKKKDRGLENKKAITSGNYYENKRSIDYSGEKPKLNEDNK